MKIKNNSESFPEVLDRLVEVMRHFHCEEPKELERLLKLPEDSLVGLFLTHSADLPRNVVRVLEAAGIRREFMVHGRGSMFSDTVDRQGLEVMKRHAAHLLKVICSNYRLLRRKGEKLGVPLHVTDRRIEQTAIEEELINLLIEALSDKTSRDHLLTFIRAEASNRTSARQGRIG